MVSELNDEELFQLAAVFFREFSRMEYALKATSYMEANRNVAKPDWEKFSRAIHSDMVNLDLDEYQSAKETLLKTPPKKQINENGKIGWSSVPPDSRCESELLIKYVCRVRNNLFHGGKFNGHWFEPERSKALIEASIVVLRACRHVCDEVNDAYNG